MSSGILISKFVYMRFYKRIFFIFLITTFSSFSQLENIKQYTSKDGLTAKNIKHFAKDTIGYLWIGSDEGLFRFDGVTFEKINAKKITALQYYQNKLYIGLENGLLIKDIDKDTYYECKQVNNILIDKNKLFVATNQGVYILKGDYLQPLSFTTNIDFSIIQKVTIFEDGYLMASNKGLFQIDNLINPKKIDVLLPGNITDVTKVNQDIYISKNNKLLEYSNLKEILTLKNVTSIELINNELWLTSKSDGIKVYNIHNFAFIKNLNKYNSLTTNYVNTVFQYFKENIFIGTNDGLYVLNRTNTQIQSKPTLHINRIYINGEVRNDLLLKKEIHLAANKNTVVLEYKTIDFKQPTKVQYQYTINGNSSGWSTSSTLQLPQLQFGDYNITIQSRVGNLKSPLKTLKLSIATPFYRNPYFLISVFVLVIIFAYLITNYRIKQIKKTSLTKIENLKKENTILQLKKKALQLQMNPHFIFNVLNGIKALGNSNNKTDFNEAVSNFSKLVRSILHNSDKEEINLQEELSTINNYIALEKLVSVKQFEFKTEVNITSASMDDVIIPTNIFQPFIENSIKHGLSENKIGLVQLKIEEKNRYLEIQIIDNGKGINTKKEKNVKQNNGLATKIIRERLNSFYHKNSLSIKEIIEKNKVTGTCVNFIIPIKTDF